MVVLGLAPGSAAAHAAGSSARAGAAAPVGNPAALVNPFIGTAHGGNTFPGADVPFGMVQWSPDTTPRADGGGYDYDAKVITGYSLTHLSGPGCAGEGDVPVLPTLGAIGTSPNGTVEPLDHSDESATPGYYQLEAGGIDTQLTTTTRSGMARFTFPTGAPDGNLLFKLTESDVYAVTTQFHVVSDTEVEGQVTSGFFCLTQNRYTLYFDMVFNRPFATSGTWNKLSGQGAYVSFDTAADPVVEAKVGVSYVSDANAALNRTVENPDWNFNAVKDQAESSWRTLLRKVEVGGGTSTQQTVFYTALYHSLLEPSTYSDVNGQYTGEDGQVHTVAAPQTVQYANYSGWDIYRSQVQLIALLAPRQTSDVVASMLNDYTQSGVLPKWDEDNGETYEMVGDPADSIIADAYAFGATDFDANQALADMETQATVPNDARPGLAYYETDGYLPMDGTYGCCNFYGPVSTQQEYDIADNSIAELAAELGDSSASASFAARAQNWQEVFNPGSGFMQPKMTNGSFQPAFEPTSQNGFVEADSYVYTPLVPFDLQGLIDAAGGPTAWVDFLNGLTTSVTTEGPTQIQMSDEPSFEIPWEYDYAGDPAGTQKVVRQIEDRLFTDKPAGLPGNDDLGATSSWYVWAALGAYPETPGSADVALASPLFPSITLTLGNGRTITENAPAASDPHRYVDGLTVDGKAWQSAYLPATAFTDGAVLDWSLGSSPTDWAAAPADAPPSSTTGLLPALGYLAGADGGDVEVSPGQSATLTLGVQSMSAADQTVAWSAVVPSGSGMVATPDGGAVTVSGEGKATTSVVLQVPPTLADGQYLVTFRATASGTTLPAVVAEVDVS